MKRKLITIEDVIDIEFEYRLSRCSGERVEGSFTYYESKDLLQTNAAYLGEHVDLCLKSPIGTRYIRNCMVARWNPSYDYNWVAEGASSPMKTEVSFVCFDWAEELIKLIPAVKP